MSPRPPELEHLRISADGRLGRLWLDRPATLNSLDAATMDELVVAAGWFDGHPDVSVVVVGGAGRAFCAGADFSLLRGDQGVGPRSADAGRRMADAVESMRPVTIARIHGHCVGGGLVLAAACDLRVAADDARFSIPEVDLGIPLAWGGIPRLVREIGPALTKELVMTCRPFDAAEAQRAGFVNRVVPVADLDATVDELAGVLVTKAPGVLAATKRHTNAVTSEAFSLASSVRDADSLIASLADPEAREAARRYLAGFD